jgi:hypothetical protein
MNERRSDLTRREHFDAARVALARRMEHLLRGLPDFDTLITRMARVQLKYESWAGMPTRVNLRRPPTAGPST